MSNGPSLVQSHRGYHRLATIWFVICLLAIAWSGRSQNVLAFQAENAAQPAPAADANSEQPAPAADVPAANNATAEEAAPSQVKESFLTILVRASGIFGAVLLIISFIMVALIVMNVMHVRRDNILPPDFIAAFEQRLEAKDYQGAFEQARSDDSFIARVLESGMSRLNRGYPQAIEGMQEVGEEENMTLEHRISYLALIGAIAPMIGLMGTVWGMIGAFEDIATSATQPKPKDLAQNIYTALFTTLEGLAVAIPAMVSYSLLRNRVAKHVLSVGIVSESLMSRFAKMPASGQSTQRSQ